MRSTCQKLAFIALAVFNLASFSAAQDAGSSVRKFGYEYFSQTHDDGNAAYSPLSIHAAFAMLTLGARGQTRAETLKVLALDEKTLLDYRSFVERLQPEEGILVLASRLWPDKSVDIEPDYVAASVKAFGAGIETLDFSRPDAARATINGWTAERTNHLIKELIPDGGVNSSTALVLSNALYFKEKWMHPFRPEATEAGVFHAITGDKEVQFMHAKSPLGWLSTGDYEGVSLNYESSNLAMALVMPRSAEKWQKVRSELGTVIVPALAHSPEGNPENQVELGLPKFKVELSSKPLNILAKMGMVEMLSAAPDLSGLSNSGPLKVDDCFHQVVVAVDEKGTEAAAATSIVVTRSVPRIVASITFDHPFFFVVYDRETHAPLFLGQVVNP